VWYTKDERPSSLHERLRIDVPQKDGSVKVIEAIKARPLPVYYAMLLPKRSVALRSLLRAIENGDREEAKAWGSLDFFYSYQVSRNFDAPVDNYGTLELLLHSIETTSIAEEQIQRWLAYIVYNTIICIIDDIELNSTPDYLEEAWEHIVDDTEALNVMATYMLFRCKNFEELREYDIVGDPDKAEVIVRLDLLRDVLVSLYQLNG